MNYDAIVVGGGISGLCAAAFLAKGGKKVLLCEKTAKTGGLVASFERNGFTFDVGARGIEDSGVLRTMLNALELNLELVPGKVSLGVEQKVISIEKVTDLKEYEKLLIHLYPENRKEIVKIVKVIKRVMRHSETIYNFDNPFFKDLIRDPKFLLLKVFPWLGQFFIAIGATYFYKKPIEKYLAKITSNQNLIDIISQHFFTNTPAFFALGYFYIYLDYLYPVGGTGMLSAKMEEYCKVGGVTLLKNCSVVKIDVEKRFVTTSNGDCFSYENLVWSADRRAMYNAIDLKELTSPRLKFKIEQQKEMMKDKKGTESVYTLYLSTKLDPSYFSKISNGHFFYTPSKRGIGKIVKEYYTNLIASAHTLELSRFKTAAKLFLKQYLENTTLEISIPVLKDPKLAPPRHTGLIVSSLFEYDLCLIIEKQGWYEEFKSFTNTLLIQILTDSVYPNLNRNIIDSFSYTPRTIERWCGSSFGAISGWAFEKNSISKSGMLNILSSIKTPIPHIYQSGQWSYSPAGIPTALITGKLCADAINFKMKLSGTNKFPFGEINCI